MTACQVSQSRIFFFFFLNKGTMRAKLCRRLSFKQFFQEVEVHYHICRLALEYGSEILGDTVKASIFRAQNAIL